MSWKGDVFNCQDHQNMPGNDIVGVIAYTLQACIDACSTVNYLQGDGTCVALVLSRDMKTSYESNFGANCWLKKTSSALASDDNETVAHLS